MMSLPKFLTTVTSFSKILAAVIFIALPFIGFYLGLKYEDQFTKYLEGRTSLDRYTIKPSPVATQSASTANWKTYTFSKYGYSVQYPSDMHKIESLSNEGRFYLSNKNAEETARYGSHFNILVYVKENPKNSLDESLNEKNLFTLFAETPGAAKSTVFKDLPALRYQTDTTDIDNKTRETLGIGGVVEYFILDKNRLIKLSGSTRNYKYITIEKLEQILSTFKFTSP